MATLAGYYLAKATSPHVVVKYVGGTGLDGFTDAVHWPTIAMCSVEGLASVALHYGRVRAAAVVQGFADVLRRRHKSP